jgi:hypothetical protein
MELSNILTDMESFSYSKPDGDKDLLPERSKLQHSATPRPVQLQLFSGNANYEKAEGSIEPRIFFVISGGTTREKAFLQELINNKNRIFNSIQLIFLTSTKKAGGLTPTMMSQQWQTIRKAGKVNLSGREFVLEDIDKVYLITDVDHYEKELRGILSNGSQFGKWIISNPDIEIWLYYCYFDNPNHDLESIRAAIPSKRSSLMKTINNQLKTGGIDPRKAFSNMRIGIANAKKNYQEDNTHFPSLFSTQMWRFCEDIDGVISKEFDIWHQAEIERIRRYRK